MTDHQTFKPIGMNISNAPCREVPTRGPLTALKEDNWLLVERVDKMIKLVTTISDRLVGFDPGLEKDPSDQKTAIPESVFNNMGAFQSKMRNQLNVLEDKLETLVKHTE